MKIEMHYGGEIEVGGTRDGEVDLLQMNFRNMKDYNFIGPVQAAALGAALTQWANQVPAALAAKAMKEDRDAREWQKSHGRV